MTTLIKIRDVNGVCMNVNPDNIDLVLPRMHRDTGRPVLMLVVGAQSKVLVSEEEYRGLRRHLNVIDPHDDPADYGAGEWKPEE